MSREGVFPLAASLDHVGPITRCVADAALMLHCIAGPDPRDPSTRRQGAPPAAPAPRDDFKRVRLGWDEEFVTMGVMPEVVAAVRAARDRVEALGATIVPVELPDLETTMTTLANVFDVEMRAAHTGFYPKRALDYGPLTRHALARTTGIWRRRPLSPCRGASIATGCHLPFSSSPVSEQTNCCSRSPAGSRQKSRIGDGVRSSNRLR